jgi:hypothetical protein
MWRSERAITNTRLGLSAGVATNQEGGMAACNTGANDTGNLSDVRVAS